MHSYLSSCLRCAMLQWKCLLVLEKFENERLLKIVPAALGKMGSGGTLHLPTWKLPKDTVKK